MKEKENKLLKWLPKIINNNKIISIDEDFLMVEDLKLQPYDYPYKTKFAVITICTQGSMKWQNNLKTYTVTAPCAITLSPNQIVRIDEVSDDYKGSAIVISEKFIINMMPDNLRMQMMIHANNNPFMPLNNETLTLFLTYRRALTFIAKMTDNPNRIEMVKHLTMVFFYMSEHSDIASATGTTNRFLCPQTVSHVQISVSNGEVGDRQVCHRMD